MAEAANVRSVKWYGWRPDTPDHRDHKFTSETTFRKHLFPPALIPPIMDQGAQGSCTGHMAAGMAEYLHRWSGQKTSAKLSPRFAYWNARYFEGSTKHDSGAEIRDAIKGLVQFGIPTNSLCPYNPREWAKAPSKGAFAGALKEIVTDYDRIANGDIGSIKGALAYDVPVGFGFSCYANFDSSEVERTGMLGMPRGKAEGGHAVWMCGFDDDLVIEDQTGAFLIANSWGQEWGCQPEGYASRGFFWIPYAYVANSDLADDFWTTRMIT